MLKNSGKTFSSTKLVRRDRNVIAITTTYAGTKGKGKARARTITEKAVIPTLAIARQLGIF